jgi:hypothetical protein
MGKRNVPLPACSSHILCGQRLDYLILLTQFALCGYYSPQEMD